MFNTIMARDYWRALAPSFHIADQGFLSPNVADASAVCAAAVDDINNEGYTQLRGIDLAADFASMAKVARVDGARSRCRVLLYL